MKAGKPSNWKWIGLFSGFTAVMCCLCLVFVLVIGGTGSQITVAATSIPTVVSNTSTLSTRVEIIPTAAPVLPTKSKPVSSPATLKPTTAAVEPVIVPSQQAGGSPLFVYFLNVGQGDSTLIQTPEGYNALIDGGEKDSGVVQYLQTLGVQRIDLMIATHPHSDHIGGLVQVLQAFPVSKVITNGQPHTTSTYENFLNGIAAAKAEYVEVKQGDLIQLGSLNFLVLSPNGNTNQDMNENSIVLRFGYGKTTFLMMGDGGHDTEARLLAEGQSLKADILKVGHHGSTSASSPAFLAAVQPQVAMYSAGINNSYHHPAPTTLAALTAVGATIYGTDKNGSIRITVDLNGYSVDAQNVLSRAPPVVATSTNSPVILPTATKAAPGTTGLQIVSVTSPVSQGATASLTAKTSPGASCSITVYYKSGPSSAQGLEPKTAGADGQVSWSWKVGVRTTPGNWRIVVSCGGVSQETTFTVQ